MDMQGYQYYIIIFSSSLKPSFFGQFKGAYTTFYKVLYKVL